MPAREAMGGAAAARVLDCYLLMILSGPAAECLADDTDRRERLAIHEAGHAVQAFRIGRSIESVVIGPDGGLTQLGAAGVPSSAALAPGHEAGRRSRWPPSDIRQSVMLARLLRPQSRKAARELLHVRQHEALLRVHADAPLIQAVAGELLRVGYLNGAQVEAIIYQQIFKRCSLPQVSPGTL